jgi:glycosyltransferase involved in cell wall biosynthesis
MVLPRVSVIIPAYNAELFLAETLGSVEAQTYEDWEALIADDLSTDRTAEVAEAFGERFTVIRRTANEGPAAARNHALSLARGELIALLDADDLWEPTHLERLVQRYDEARGREVPVGIVTGDARLLTPGGLLPQTYYELMGSADGVTLEQLLVSNRVFVGGLFPRKIVDEVGDFCSELFGTEDYDLWLRIVEAGYVVVATPEVLTVYRQGRGSVSTDLPRMARSLQLTYRRALERGKLTPRERRIATRQLRLQRALEQAGLIMAERRDGGRGLGRLVRSFPLFLRAAVENPDRWRTAIAVAAGRGSPLSQVVK